MAVSIVYFAKTGGVLQWPQQHPFSGSAAVSVPTGSTTNLSGTVAVTNTFQSVQSANAARCGGLIQNNGLNPMYVFFGPLANAAKAKAVVLAAGVTMPLTAPGVCVMDEICITGTAGDAFYCGVQ